MRLTLKSLARTPGLTFAIVGTLTVALAFTIATFGLLNCLLRHPYPYPKLDQLLLVSDARPREGAHQGHSIAVADFLDARRSVPAFSSLAGNHHRRKRDGSLSPLTARGVEIRDAEYSPDNPSRPRRIQGVERLRHEDTVETAIPSPLNFRVSQSSVVQDELGQLRVGV
jgi:hypothetical protein